MQDITEGMPCYPPHLAKDNEHVGKCLSCQLRVKGHSRGLGLLGVKEVIFEGLLIGQGLCRNPVLPAVSAQRCADTDGSAGFLQKCVT
jgi:hypothetical protein